MCERLFFLSCDYHLFVIEKEQYLSKNVGKSGLRSRGVRLGLMCWNPACYNYWSVCDTGLAVLDFHTLCTELYGTGCYMLEYPHVVIKLLSRTSENWFSMEYHVPFFSLTWIHLVELLFGFGVSSQRKLERV